MLHRGGACGVARHYAAPSEADDGDEEVAWAATRMDTGCDALKRDTALTATTPLEQRDIR